MTIPLRLLVLAAIFAGCSGTEGHVVKGPVARAALSAHQLDPAAEDLAGQIVAEGTTDHDGSGRVEFSRGDEIAFGRQVCGFDRDATRFEWFVP